MLTKEQFAALRVGQVVLVNGKPRVIRSISVVKRPKGPRVSITFAIKRRSWTGRIYTTYDYHSLKEKLTLPHRQPDAAAIGEAEGALLRSCNFDVVRELERELKEEVRLAGCGFGKCDDKAVKLARKALVCARKKARKK
jgi:hypothetical protein